MAYGGGNYLDAISTVVTSYIDPNPDHGGGDSQGQLESSDHLEFEIYEEPKPTYMDINLYIIEATSNP